MNSEPYDPKQFKVVRFTTFQTWVDNQSTCANADLNCLLHGKIFGEISTNIKTFLIIEMHF